MLIPEIKGVILSKGVPGVYRPGTKPLENVLLAGCDMRADICQSLFGRWSSTRASQKYISSFPDRALPR